MRTVCGINDLGPPASLARHLISSAAVEPEAAAREDLRPCLGSLDPPGGISMKYRNILASLSGAAAVLAASAAPALAQEAPSIDSGDTAWMMTATALVLLMTRSEETTSELQSLMR